jgi:hypothetical protein
MPKLPNLNDTTYWTTLAVWAHKESDGCTGVKDWWVEACWEHDWHWRYAVTLYGDPITFDEANARFRQSIQMRSLLGRFNPLSWIRWEGVRRLGRGIWDDHRRKNLPAPFVLAR